MANFSALKTAIQNAIKQNGNEEITGDVLQQILLSIVSTMGDGSINTIEQNLSQETLARQNGDNTLQSNINAEALARGNADTQLQNAINAIKANIDNGYVYAGIATPSSTPVSGKVFYIATTAGTYTNFGGQVLTQGINILRFNGSAWSSQQLIGIDDVPTAGSNSLVKSGGVQNELALGAVYDVSAKNPTAGPNNDGKFTLEYILDQNNVNTLIPAAYRKGGMSIKFVQSSDHKYVQYFLTKDEWSTDEVDWEKLNLAEELYGSVSETPVTLSETDGLIKPNGTIDTTTPSAWSYSQDISLNKGDTIKLTAYGTVQAAAISIKENNTYTMPAGCTWDSVSKAEKSFSYTATEDCVVVLCYRNADNPRTASIVSTTEGLIDQVEKKVDDVETEDNKTYARKKGEWVEMHQVDVDDTLTQSGAAADAKVVGDVLNGEPADTEFHSIDIPIIEGAVIQSDNTEATGSPYWSRTQAYKLNSGDTIRLNGAGIQSIYAIAKTNGDNTFTGLVLYEGTSATQQQIDYQATEDCYVTLSFRNPTPWTHSFAIKRSATKGLIDNVNDLKESLNTLKESVEDLSENDVKTTIIEVGVGKIYTSLVSAIEAITDSSEHNQYEIHLFPGTYETIDTSLIVEGGNYKGLVIPDYVSIIGIGDRNSIIISGSISAAIAGEYSSATINKISAINMMLNGTLENVTLYAKNIRYCNHNDGTHTVFVKQIFKDVSFIYDTLEITGVAANCNGIGNECGKDILFDHCVFDNRNNNGGGVFMHDNASASEKQGARLEIRNCIFKGAGIALSNSGGSYECYAILTGNRFVSDMLVTSANNTITTNRWKVIASSNLDFGYTKSSGMSEVDLSGDITAFCNEQSA